MRGSGEGKGKGETKNLPRTRPLEALTQNTPVDSLYLAVLCCAVGALIFGIR